LQHKIELALIISLFSPSQAFEGKQSHFIRSGHDTLLLIRDRQNRPINRDQETWFPFRTGAGFPAVVPRFLKFVIQRSLR
jgi:hypothetical protein